MKALLTIGSDEWYTPQYMVEHIEKVLCTKIDLDPCGSKYSHFGKAYYDQETNGLDKPWYGNVFMNAPFSLNELFFKKAIQELESNNAITITIVCHNNTDNRYYQRLLNSGYVYRVDFPVGRTKFLKRPKYKRKLVSLGGATKGQMIIYLSRTKSDTITSNFLEIRPWRIEGAI